MRTLITALIALSLSGCVETGQQSTLSETPEPIAAPPASAEELCLNPMDIPEDTGKPNVLIIGDSISVGYTPALAQELSGYDVVHTPCNALNTANGEKKLAEWLALRDRWDLVIFNFGLWDMNTVEPLTWQEYGNNLRRITPLIKASTNRAVFVTTTAVPSGVSYIVDADAQFSYRTQAVTIMFEMDVQIIDARAFTLSHPELYLSDDDVHLTPEGYQALARFIALAL